MRRKLEIQLPSWTQLRMNDVLIPIQRRHEADKDIPCTCCNLFLSPLWLLFRRWDRFAVYLDIVMKEDGPNELLCLI